MTALVKWSYRLWIVVTIASLVFTVWALAEAQDDDSYGGWELLATALVLILGVLPAGFWLIEHLEARAGERKGDA